MAAAPPREDERSATAAAERTCPRCGSPHQPLQEYCLECGARLGDGTSAYAVVAGARVEPWYERAWTLPLVVAAVVALLATVAAVAARSQGGGEESRVVATLPEPASVPLTDTAIEVPTQPTTEATRTEPAATQPVRRAQPRGRIIEWPPNKNGWTIVLASVPKADGRPVAVARARAATDAGLSPVGVVDSDQYASLHPGYYVVFTGVYETQAQAERASVSVRSAGYEDAYTKPVTR